MILDDLVELRETINDRKNYKEHALDFSNYLASDYKKFCVIITREQYVIDYSNDDKEHIELLSTLMTRLRGKDKMYTNDTIILLGTHDDVDISIPNEINYQQYRCLCDIIYYIKNYNRNNNKRMQVYLSNEVIGFIDYTNNLIGLLENLVNYISLLPNVDDKKIIGRKLNYEKSINFEFSNIL